MRAEITKLPFWNDLSDDEQEMVGSATVFRHYDIGQLIHGSCDGGGFRETMREEYTGQIFGL